MQKIYWIPCHDQQGLTVNSDKHISTLQNAITERYWLHYKSTIDNNWNNENYYKWYNAEGGWSLMAMKYHELNGVNIMLLVGIDDQ